MKYRVILAVLGSLSILVMCILTLPGGDFKILISVASLLIVALGALIFVVANYPPEEIAQCLRFSIGKKVPTPDEGNRAGQLLDNTARALYAFGLLGYFTGLLYMLMHLGEPSKFGMAIALSLISVVYAVFLAEIVIRSMRIQIQRRMNSPEPHPTGDAKTNNGGAALFTILLTVMGLIPFLLVV